MSQAYAVKEKIETEEVEGTETINFEKLQRPAGGKIYYVERVDRPNGGLLYRGAKRVFDFTVALVGLVLLCIPMAIIALVIRLDSPGPVIYRQERLGLRGKRFWILKFRSMYRDAEAHGAQWAEACDSRVTRVGAFLRKTRLDELPQLLNILSGQMSLVGPRPERECFYREFEKYIHGFSNRLVVKPGLTGLAQVQGGYDLPPEEKVRFDMEYIRTRSVKLDFKCILMTVGVVFTHDGAR